jgi:hypothetical protein
VEKYVKNNKRIKYFKFFFRAYRIPHLEFVSHARFEFDEIAKPFKYLYYWEWYASTTYLNTYLGFLAVTQSMSGQWVNQWVGHWVGQGVKIGPQ